MFWMRSSVQAALVVTALLVTIGLSIAALMWPYPIVASMVEVVFLLSLILALIIGLHSNRAICWLAGAYFAGVLTHLACLMSPMFRPYFPFPMAGMRFWGWLAGVEDPVYYLQYNYPTQPSLGPMDLAARLKAYYIEFAVISTQLGCMLSGAVAALLMLAMIALYRRYRRPVETPKPTRRWYQFSLMTVGLYMLVTALLMTWISGRRDAYFENREVIQQLFSQGVEVQAIRDRIAYYHQPVLPRFEQVCGIEHPRRIVMIVLPNKEPKQFDWKLLTKMPELEKIVASSIFDIKDAEFANFSHLKKLRWFEAARSNMSKTTIDVLRTNCKDMRTFICHGQIGEDEAHLISLMTELEILEVGFLRFSDYAAVRLSTLKNLRDLELGLDREGGFSMLTKEGFQNLAKLESLERISLHGKFDDELQECLQNLPKLRVVDFSESQITDVTLQRLAKIATLEKLSVFGSKVTPEGLAAFQSERPDVMITPKRASLRAPYPLTKSTVTLNAADWK